MNVGRLTTNVARNDCEMERQYQQELADEQAQEQE